MAKISGSELIARALLQEGVHTVFTIAGDHILPVLDVMADHPFRFIGVRHEEAAVHMADVWARTTGGIGVSMYTTPGFANALPGLAYALYSEAPLLSISGCAELAEMGRGSMQEIDQVSAAKPFTKASWLVHDTRRIPDFIARAVRLAFSGRRGPVHLTIPVDVQEIEVDESEVVFYQPAQYRFTEHGGADPADIERALDLIQASQRPYAIAQGPAGYGDGESLLRFVETTNVPLFTEDWCRGLAPDNHPKVFGYFERGLNRAARMLPQADLVLLLGRKQDYSITYLRPPAVAADAKIIQIVPDADQLGLNRGVDVGMVGDVGAILGQLADAARKRVFQPLPWLDTLRAAQADQAKWTAELAQPADGPMHALYVHKVIGEMITPDDVLTFDGGDFCHLGRGYHQAQRPGRWWYLPNLGLLGSSMPSGIAAKLANPNRRVISFTGDGAFGFNAMELETAFREKVGLVVVLGNDSTWGIDNGIQIGVYGRGVATDLSDRVRYDKVAEALGGHGEYVQNAAELKPALDRAFAAAAEGKVALVNVLIQRFISPRAENSINRIKTGLAKHLGHSH